MNESCLTFIHALSPLHAGTGQGVGVIDLPIAREKATNLPFLPGSTLKGTLRDELDDDEKCKEVFGDKGDNKESAKSGSAIFSDQKLLCLPVRSMFGTFAWVTSPFILERFKRDCEMTGANFKFEELPALKRENCLVSGSVLAAKIDEKNSVILEDLDLTIDETQGAKIWAAVLGGMIFGESSEENNWSKLFSERFCIVSDDVMNFLAETATEITARNVLNDNKTSDNLWYEESLPTETILSGVLATVKNRNNGDSILKTVEDLCKKPIQLGGNMTVGRGLCRVIIANGGENNAHS